MRILYFRPNDSAPTHERLAIPGAIQDFSRLDSSGRQIRPQPQISRQKIVLRQFLGQHPSNSLESPGHQIFPSDLRDVEADLERLRRLRIRVRNPGNLNSLSQSPTKFLTQFASKRDFRRLSLLDSAPLTLP